MQIIIISMLIILILMLIVIIFLFRKLFEKNNESRDFEIERMQMFFKDTSNSMSREINGEIINFKDGIQKTVLDNIDNLVNKVDYKLEANNKVSKEIDGSINLFKDKIKENIQKDVTDLSNKVNDSLKEGFKASNETFKEVLTRLNKIDEAQRNIENLSKEITELQKVLNDKKSRGTFGEGQLEQILDYVYGDSGLYQRQYVLTNGTKADAITFIGDKILAIDSKFPLENYKKFIETNDKNDARKFIQDVKKHIDDISSKYIIEGITINQAIMFLPSESIFLDIYSKFDEIVDYSQKKRIWITGKTNLMAYISTVQYAMLEIEKSRNTDIILKNLTDLSVEFERYIKRWNDIEKSFKSVSDNMANLSITHGKILKKFDGISKINNDTK